MFEDLIEWPIVSERLQWEGKQVLRDLSGVPHILFRLRLTGTYFAERSAEAFVRIGNVRSHFVQIASDGLSLNAYFDQPPPADGLVEFGYGRDVRLRCTRRFQSAMIGRLTWELLPPNVRNLEYFANELEGTGPR